jgi:type IV secretion system protein VirB3
MWRGVPIEAVCLNLMATTTLFVMMKNPFYMTIGVVLHYATRAFVSRDYNVFGIWRVWLETKGRARNTANWGGSSVSPLPLGPARRAREVRVHA